MSVQTSIEASRAVSPDVPAFQTLLEAARDLSAGALDLPEFLQRQCDGIRELTGARAAAIVLGELVSVSGMDDWESARYSSLLACRERLREPSLAAQPIPLAAEPGCVYLFGLASYGGEIELLLETFAEQMALARECCGRVSDLQSKASHLQDTVQQLRAQLAAEVEERRATERALQQAKEKLTEWVYELAQRNRDMALLKEITDSIQSCIGMEEANLVIAEYLPKLFEANSGAVCVLDSAGNLVKTVASWGDAEGLARAFLPQDCWSLRRARPHWVRDSQSALRCSHVGNPLPAWYMCLPLIAHGQAIGLLHVNSKVAGRAAKSDETGELPPAAYAEPGLSAGTQKLAEIVAEQLGMALANLQLREALRTQAVRDPLTGLFNRRYMEESLEREVRRARRAGTTFGCVMLDIDHFKKFNDTHGHSAGDMLLRHAGAFLMSELRRSDVACRYGGEEFTLILPDATLEETVRRAQEIRLGWSEMRLPDRPNEPPPTVSMGVAALPDHGTDADSVLLAADSALYRAKSDGRNRVCTGYLPGATPQ